MALIKKAGTELETGIGISISGAALQSAKKDAGGELKVYRDEDGNELALYLFDGHTALSFEGLLPAASALGLKEKGSTISVTDGSSSVTYYVETCEVQWTNDDVARVSVSARTYTNMPTGTGATT